MRKKSLYFYLVSSGFIVLYFTILQLLYNLNEKFFYAGVGVLFLALAFAVAKYPKDTWEYLSSIKLAISIIIYLTIATVIGTLILQNVEEAKYLQHYSEGFYRFIKLFTLQDTYHSIWFMALVGLLNLNLLFCTFEKLPFAKKKTGFFLIHLSIFVIVLGGSISALWGVKGYIHFLEGETHKDFNITKYNMMLDKKQDLGFGVRLDKFEIEYYPPDYRVYVYTRKSTDKDFGKPYSLKAEEGKEYKIREAKAKLKIEKFYKDYAQKEILTEGENGLPGVEVELIAPNQKISGIFFDTPGRDRFFLPDGDGLVVFKWEKPKNVKDILKEKFILTVQCGNDTKTINVEFGKTYDFSENYTVKADKFVPYFSIDTKTGEVVSKGDNPGNPAIHLIFTNKKTGAKTEHWAFQNFPEFSHGQRIPDNCSVKFLYIPSPKDKPIYLVTADKKLYVYQNGRKKQEKTLENNTLEFKNYKLVFKKFVKNGKLESKEYSASDNYNNPVVKVLWEKDGKSTELMFSSKDKQATFVENGKVALLLRDKNTDPKDYRSYVTVIDNGKEVKKHVIEVNSPLVYKGYYFYQSNYDPNNPHYSGISVSKDPGAYIVFLGFFMLTLGGILRFYFKM